VKLDGLVDSARCQAKVYDVRGVKMESRPLRQDQRVVPMPTLDLLWKSEAGVEEVSNI
jgi:hypothetical protein